MLTAAVFFAVLAAVVAVALARGGRDERTAALAVLGAAVATPALVTQQFAAAEVGILLVDVILLLILAAIAFQSDRFWPLWAAGFQLGALVVHFAAVRLPHLVPAAYAETLVIWSYPVLASLLFGTIAEGARRRRH